MFRIADSLRSDVESAAREMINSGKDITPLLSPDGHPMLYISTDKSKLRMAFFEVSVEGATVFVGDMR